MSRCVHQLWRETLNHKDGPLEQTPLLEPHTVALAKLLTPPGRERLVQHARGVLEVRLHLWRVHTHGIDAGIRWQGYVQGFPLSRHALADWAFQAVHHAQQTDLPG